MSEQPQHPGNTHEELSPQSEYSFEMPAALIEERDYWAAKYEKTESADGSVIILNFPKTEKALLALKNDFEKLEGQDASEPGLAILGQKMRTLTQILAFEKSGTIAEKQAALERVAREGNIELVVAMGKALAQQYAELIQIKEAELAEVRSQMNKSGTEKAAEKPKEHEETSTASETSSTEKAYTMEKPDFYFAVAPNRIVDKSFLDFGGNKDKQLFIAKNTSGNQAEFTMNDDERHIKRALDHDDMFNHTLYEWGDVAKIEGSKHRVITLEPGIMEQQANGSWRILKPAQLQFITPKKD